MNKRKSILPLTPSGEASRPFAVELSADGASPFPNDLIDRMAEFSSSEWVLISVILSLSINRPVSSMSLTVLTRKSGLSRPTVIACIKSLLDRDEIIKTEDAYSLKPEALRIVTQARERRIERVEKRKIEMETRKRFNSIRRGIVKWLAARDGYKCSEPECRCKTDLEVDHIIPITKGGTNDLSNFQLLCHSHNSSKGNRIRNNL